MTIYYIHATSEGNPITYQLPVERWSPSLRHAFIRKPNLTVNFPEFAGQQVSLYFTDNPNDPAFRDPAHFVRVTTNRNNPMSLYSPEEAVTFFQDQHNQIQESLRKTQESQEPSTRDQPSQAIQTQADSQTPLQAKQTTQGNFGMTPYERQKHTTHENFGMTPYERQKHTTQKNFNMTLHERKKHTTQKNFGITPHERQKQTTQKNFGMTPHERKKQTMQENFGMTLHERKKHTTQKNFGMTLSERQKQTTQKNFGMSKKKRATELCVIRTGMRPNQITKIGKDLNIPGKTVAKILTILKQLDQTLIQQKEQQKSFSNFTPQNNRTISINGRRAQLHDVPDTGMNCLIYAMLAAHGHDIHTEATEQIVTDTRDFLRAVGRAQENELLEMDTATSQGAEALAYLRSMGHMNPDQGLTIHATWQNPQDNRTYIIRQDVIPSQSGASPIELYLNLDENHYNYIQYLD